MEFRTGKNLRRWKEQQHSACPTCGVENENTHHILTCPHPTATAQWKQSVRSLENWLIQQSTHPDVTRIIIENLHSWHDNRPPVNYYGSHPFLASAQSHQSNIGWGAFLRGFATKDWIAAQQCHYSHLNSKKTGKRWLAALLKKLWGVSWDMWRFRNGIQHSQSNDIPTNFTFLLTTAIVSEINHGHRLLPPICDYLFSRNHTSILKGSVNSKKLWLATV